MKVKKNKGKFCLNLQYKNEVRLLIASGGGGGNMFYITVLYTLPKSNTLIH